MATAKLVLIIGGSGFVGTHLSLRLRDTYKVYAGFRKNQVIVPGVTPVPLDLMDAMWVKRVMYSLRPDAVVFAMGQYNPDVAEIEARHLEALCASGTANVVNSAGVYQPRFIFISSAYAFDGSKGNYHENDTVSPITGLGKAKVSGENFVRGRASNFAIVRSSPLYGRGNPLHYSLFDTLRTHLEQGKTVELSKNEVHGFTYIGSLVDMVEKLIDGGPKNKVIHLGGLTKMTPYEFGQAMAKRFGYDPNLIQPQKPKFTSKLGLEPPVLDYSLNFTPSVETLKLQPLLLEQGFDLLEKDLISRL